MARIIVVTSGKGGVGKTTTSASFASGLALLGHKTAVIDFDVGLRNLPIDAPVDPELIIEQLLELCLVPVCSPKLIATLGPFTTPEALSRVPLIHDDTLADRVAVATWGDWFKAAGVPWLEACSTDSLSGMTPMSLMRRMSWMSSNDSIWPWSTRLGL